MQYVRMSGLIYNCLTILSFSLFFSTLDLIESTQAFVALAFVVRTIEGIGAAALRTSCYTIIASQFSEGIGTTFVSIKSTSILFNNYNLYVTKTMIFFYNRLF